MSHVTKEGIEVKVGQVWVDLDKRMGERYMKVVALEEEKAVVMRCNIGSRIIASTRTRLSIRRMHKSSTGWALFVEA